MKISPLFSSRPEASPSLSHPSSTYDASFFSTSSLTLTGGGSSCFRSFCTGLRNILRAPLLLCRWLVSLFSSRTHSLPSPRVDSAPPSTSDPLPQSSALLPRCTLQKTIDPNHFPHNLQNQNKQWAYTLLVKNPSFLGPPIEFSKYTLDSREEISKMPVFGHTPSITSKKGVFQYEASARGNTDWFANFADSHIFGYCETELLAQDELQVLELCGLAHVRTALIQENLAYLKPNEICLFKNVWRFGSLNTQRLYGNNFARSSEQDITNNLTVFNTPEPKNIFLIVAPRISGHLSRQLYKKEDLEHLFYTAYTAFSALKQNSANKAVAHTGNWGTGAFGNGVRASYLMQIAAAHCAGVDLQMYPLEHSAELHNINALLARIKKNNPNMTVGAFLEHVALHVQGYNLLYGTPNGT